MTCRCPILEGVRVCAYKPFELEIPIRTIGQNAREHFAVKAKRIRRERQVVRFHLDLKALKCPIDPPMVVTLTRLSSARMDSDGPIGAMKATRDEVASWLGIDDRHDDLVEYRYGQAKCERGKFGVRIVIVGKARRTG